MSDVLMSDYWYVEDNKAWFVSTWNKSFYEVDLKTRKISYVDDIPDDMESMHLYVTCVKYGNRIYFFPDLGKHIYQYNLELKQWSCIYENYYKETRAGVKLLTKEDNIAVMFARGTNSVFVFDLEKGVIEEEIKIENDGNDTWQATYNTGRVYITDRDLPVVYILDLKSRRTEKILVNQSSSRFETIIVVREDVFLTGKDKCVYVVSLKDKGIEVVPLPEEFGEYILTGENIGKINCQDSFIYPAFIENAFVNGKVFFLPYITNGIICMNVEKRSVKYIDMPMEKETTISLRRDCKIKFTELKAVYDDYLVLSSYKNMCYEVIDTKKDFFNNFDCELEEGVLAYHFCRQPVKESRDFSLQGMIRYVKGN